MPHVMVRVVQSDRDREILMAFKEWAQVIVEADKSKIYRVGKQAGEPEKELVL